MVRSNEAENEAEARDFLEGRGFECVIRSRGEGALDPRKAECGFETGKKRGGNAVRVVDRVSKGGRFEGEAVILRFGGG